MKRFISLLALVGLLLTGVTTQVFAYPRNPEWVKRSVEDITIQVPGGWTYLEENDLARQGIQVPPDQRGKSVIYFLTFPGKEFLASDCLIGMGRVQTVELDQFGVTPGSETITVAGQKATRYALQRGKDDDAMRGILIVMQTPHADGKQVGIVLLCKSKVWVSYEPVFEYMVSTLTIGSGGPPPVNGVSGQVTSNRVPVADVTVFVGENLKLKIDPGTHDVLQGTALFVEAKTDVKGQFTVPLPPGFYSLVFWKAGYTPVVFERVPSPPGRVATEIAVDAQPGGSGRHQAIDLTGIPRETPLGQPGVTGVRGRIRVTDEGNPAPSDGVTMLIGRDLSLLGDSPTDTILGTLLLAEVKTDAQGRFYFPVPPGNYSLIAWKRNHIPIHGINVTVRPNSYFRPQEDYLRMVPNDIGAFHSGLIYDRQVGAAGRHLDYDLERVPKAAAGGAGTVVAAGTIRLSDRGLRLPGKDVQVIYGKELTVGVGATVRVSGREIVSTTTDDQGRYTLNVQPGAYQVVVFKAGYRVDEPVTVMVPDQGGLNKTLLRDRSPAADERRLEIEKLAPPKSSALPRAWTPSAIAALVLFVEPDAPAVRNEARNSGDAVIAIPSDWRAEAGLPDDEARWYLGNPDNPDAAIAILRDDDFSGLIDSLRGSVRTWTKVGTAEASLYEGRLGESDHALLLIVTKARPDGRKLAVLATSSDPRWEVMERKLRASLASLRLRGVEPTEPRPPETTPPEVRPPITLPPESKPPLAGPEVSLPQDPNEPVVIFDYVGGFSLPRRTKDPQLIIRAGGRVTLIDPWGQLPKVESTITRENLLKFLEFALVEKRFFSIDGQEVEKAIRAEQQRGGVIITDLPQTVIHLRTGKSEWRVAVRGPQMYSEAFPNMKPLKDLAAIETRLEQYIEKLRALRPK